MHWPAFDPAAERELARLAVHLEAVLRVLPYYRGLDDDHADVLEAEAACLRRRIAKISGDEFRRQMAARQA
jgi:hypothetical protein